MAGFRHILVPLNFTARNDKALDEAHRIASQTGAKVSLIHVIEQMSDDGDAELAAFSRGLVEAADKQLMDRASRFRDSDIPVACESLVGNRASAVIQYANRKDVDLVVLSSHAITRPDEEKPAISLSYRIAVLAPCAVLLLKF